MEVHAEGSCRVVYFCASREDGEVHELHHQGSPPGGDTNATIQDDGALQRLHGDVRTLLDQDLGGFDQVFVCSRAEECLERVEAWANSASVAVLVEFCDVASDGAVSAGFLKDEQGSYAFLRTLTADVQGARYQKNVMPFAVLTGPDAPDPDSAVQGSITSSFLDAGALDILHSPLQVGDINRFVGHVKSLTRPPAHLLGAPMAQNLVDSIRDTSEPNTAAHRPDQTLTSAQKTAVEQAVCSWAFPAQKFNMDELTYAALFMLEHVLRVPELHPYGLSRARLMTFLLATRRQYKHANEVFYHNWRHAVDVTQSIFYFLLDVRLCPSLDADARTQRDLNAVERVLTALDGLILIVSAVGHDVGHPGVNNAFLVACNHPLAQLYNDKSVLENYHCGAYSQLLRRHWPALGNIAGFRSTMISTILATDMQRHFEYMSKLGEFKQKVNDNESPVDEWPEKEQEQTRELMMSLLIKAADISNVARPFEVSANWAKILMEEFARQGELESELQIPTCLFGGPPNTEDLLAAAESQKGFMDLFGHPLFQGIADVMPSLSCAVGELEKNQQIWTRKIEKQKQQRDAGDRERQLTFSSVSSEEVEEAMGKHKSEPMVVPSNGPPSTPTTPQKRVPVTSLEPSPASHPNLEHRRHISVGVTFDESKRHPVSHLGPGAVPLSPHTASSRRSSKDIALDQLQQLSAYAQQNINPGSRRGSADAGWHVQQSYPNSRRGSKDESLTTILVTNGSSPNRRSPTSPARPARSSPTKNSASKRPSVSTKDRGARTSVPSCRSNTASTATVTSVSQPSPSTQPSSLAADESSSDNDPTPPAPATLRPSNSIPATEDPFLGPSAWPNDPSPSPTRFPHRTASIPGALSSLNTHSLPATPPQPPRSSGLPKGDIADDASNGSTRWHSTPPKVPSEPVVRESRSRSRLRGLKFWRRRRDVEGNLHGSGDSLEEGIGGVQPP